MVKFIGQKWCTFSRHTISLFSRQNSTAVHLGLIEMKNGISSLMFNVVDF